MNISLYRNTEYVMNKVAMHVLLALLNGFSFWMIGDSLSDLQQNLFTVFNVIFVSPGVIAQLQPLFIDRRDIFESREKKSKMVSDHLPRIGAQMQLLIFDQSSTTGVPSLPV
jgi:ABC-type multidrug transport system permease subunit